MTGAETIARIRFEHFQNGKGIKRIACELKIARDTVRKVLRSGGGRRVQLHSHAPAAAEVGRVGGDPDGDLGSRGQAAEAATPLDSTIV